MTDDRQNSALRDADSVVGHPSSVSLDKQSHTGELRLAALDMEFRMPTPERVLGRIVGDGEVNHIVHQSNAPTQELSIDHFRRDMFDAAMQGLVDTLDRLYYLRMLVQSSVSYGGDLERVIGLPDLEDPINTIRRLAERLQGTQDDLHGGPLQISTPSGD